MTLHRLKDYLDLRRRLPEVREAVVIGGGTHANETVMSLLHWGVRVHWLIRGKQFLSHTLDYMASELVLNSVRRAGAIIHTETEVIAIFGGLASVAGVLTNTEEVIPCQLVLCCTGTSPAQGLAAQCTEPILFKNGILVDTRLRTSVQDIYAAGDVAALPNPQTCGYETRAEWYSAVTQGKIAGAMMAGRTAIATELFGAHWHGTQLGDLSMLTVGDPLGTSTNEQTEIYTDRSGGGYRRLVAVDDRLVGYISIGPTRPDGLSIKRLIDEGLSIRNLFKPLLKGKCDGHRYLTKVMKAPTAKNMETQPLPTLKQLQALQWPERRYIGPPPTIQIPPAARQTDAIDLNMLIQQTIREDAAHKPRQAYLTVETGSIRKVTREQFMKPGFIDIRPRKREREVVNASAT
jgi:NAD(P)H-nitrite reductase large subunit